MNAGFYVLLPAGVAQPDALGVWQIQAAPASFTTLAASPETVMRWQVLLPADPRAASARLAQSERLLAIANAALPDAERRLRAFAVGWPAQAESFSSVPFDLRQPERALSLLLAEARDNASFAGDGGLFAELRALATEARGFVEQVRQMLRLYSEVETVQGGAVLARTGVHWLGGAQAVGRSNLRAEQRELHRRGLALALETQRGWTRLATQTALSVLLLGGGLATGNPFLVAGGVWKFIKSVLADWQQQGNQAR